MSPRWPDPGWPSVLVDQRRVHADMPHPAHQLARRGPRNGGQVITGVPEVVHVNSVQASLRQCSGPYAGEVRPQRENTSRADEPSLPSSSAPWSCPSRSPCSSPPESPSSSPEWSSLGVVNQQTSLPNRAPLIPALIDQGGRPPAGRGGACPRCAAGRAATQLVPAAPPLD
jgi:hypothetical protein